MAYRPLDLTGKVAVVTGGTSGIGRALTRGLAEAGADVVPTSRRAEQVAAAADEVAALGRRTLRVSSDVTDRRSLEDALSAVVKALGRVDILVNCAGRTQRTPTLDVSEQEWSAIVDTNLTGTLRACQVFGRHMLERGSGR
ncbi:MAG TPA: SDR family NAD(P)-dependent oxidoreductase, partial [Vicinamibacteria bacterium]